MLTYTYERQDIIQIALKRQTSGAAKKKGLSDSQVCQIIRFVRLSGLSDFQGNQIVRFVRLPGLSDCQVCQIVRLLGLSDCQVCRIVEIHKSNQAII
jgi:hypothetical protein